MLGGEAVLCGQKEGLGLVNRQAGSAANTIAGPFSHVCVPELMAYSQTAILRNAKR